MCRLNLLHTIQNVNGDTLGVLVRASADVSTRVPLLATFHHQGTDQGFPGDLLLVFIDVGPVTPVGVVLADLDSVVEPIDIFRRP